MAGQQSLVGDMRERPNRIAGAHGSFYSLSLQLMPLRSRVVAFRGLCWHSFFLLSTLPLLMVSMVGSTG